MPRTITFDLTFTLAGTIVIDDGPPPSLSLTADTTLVTSDTTFHTADEA